MLWAGASITGDDDQILLALLFVRSAAISGICDGKLNQFIIGAAASSAYFLALA